MENRILGIIPARFASSRLPGKPLVDIHGKPMIQRVYEQVQKSTSLSGIVVATDDQRIMDVVTGFGGNCEMTSTDIRSGTDRCASIVKMEKYSDFDVVINIQGDEPMIDPGQIDLLCNIFESPEAEIGTLVRKCGDGDDVFNPNNVKVLFNKKSKAIYFSRSVIPHIRGKEQSEWMQTHQYYHHIGLYGYRKEVLLHLSSLQMSSLEKAESLEQLRWIEEGYDIFVRESEHENHAVDTPEDLEKIRLLYKI